MKTHTIKTPTAELLIVELPENSTFREIFGLIGAYENNSQNYHLTVYNFSDYTLLGTPDEIREEDAKELVEKVMNNQHFQNYKGRKENDFANLWCKTAKESLLSLLDTEIYWDVNPIKVHTWASENADIYHKQWHKAEKKTFDRNRSVIFKKVTPKI